MYNCSPCFSVEPSRGILEEEETMQFTANFLSEKSGDFKANLFLNYESGILTISLILNVQQIYMWTNYKYIKLYVTMRKNYRQEKNFAWNCAARRWTARFVLTGVASGWRTLIWVCPEARTWRFTIEATTSCASDGCVSKTRMPTFNEKKSESEQLFLPEKLSRKVSLIYLSYGRFIRAVTAIFWFFSWQV